MGVRRKSRELVLQMLYQADMGKQNAEQVRKTFWKEKAEVSEEVRQFADDLFLAACDEKRYAQVEKLIEEHSAHWRMERMAAVDRNLLRSAITEMVAFPETPRAVVINESLEIAHKFSSPESVNFLNGVLDGVRKDLEKKK